MLSKSMVDLAIATVCTNIIQEPLLCFSEADFQYLLTAELKNIDELKKLVDTGLPRGLKSKGHYRTSLVHQEYGAGDSKRVDIVVFDQKDAVRIKGTNLDLGGGRYLDPRFAFELGTEKSNNVCSHMRKDLEKVDCATECGYVIHIFRDTTKSAIGGRRNKTEKNIHKAFRVPVWYYYKKQNSKNKKILAILIRTERDVKKMRGKCEIFMGQSKDDWQKVDVSNKINITEKILKVLK